MKWVAMVRTSDGVLHDDKPKADKHAEQRYGEALTRIAHELVHTDGKYSKVIEYIDANLEKFAELHALKRDIELEKTDIFGE